MNHITSNQEERRPSVKHNTLVQRSFKVKTIKLKPTKIKMTINNEKDKILDERIVEVDVENENDKTNNNDSNIKGDAPKPETTKNLERRNSHEIINLEFSRRESTHKIKLVKRFKSKQSKESSKKKQRKKYKPSQNKNFIHNTSFETNEKISQSIRTELPNNRVRLHGKLNNPSSQSPTWNAIKVSDQNIRQMKIQKRHQLKSAHPASMTLLNKQHLLASVSSQGFIQSGK